MLYEVTERPAWTIKKDDKLPGIGRVKSVEQLADTDAVCIVFPDGDFAIYNANEKVAVCVAKG